MTPHPTGWLLASLLILGACDTTPRLQVDETKQSLSATCEALNIRTTYAGGHRVLEVVTADGALVARSTTDLATSARSLELGPNASEQLAPVSASAAALLQYEGRYEAVSEELQELAELHLAAALRSDR